MRSMTEEEDEAEVSMSPLIDCVFLLLIFFLVSTMTRKDNKDIDIDLPESSSAIKILPSNDTIVIGIDIDGTVYYEGTEETLTQLHSSLRETGMTNPDVRIRLDVDSKVVTSKVIEVLDVCQFNNLKNIGIRTYDENYNTK